MNLLDPVKDTLDLGSYACEHIIQAARDISMARKDVFPADLFVKGKKQSELTEFDIFRRKIDLEHVQLSREWLYQVDDDNKRKTLRKKLCHGLQSIVWFAGKGYPHESYSQCCQAIEDAFRLIKTRYRGITKPLLDPQLLAERIMVDPDEMVKILENVQSAIRDFSSIEDESDELIDTYKNIEFNNAIGWDQIKAVGPAAVVIKKKDVSPEALAKAS